MEVDEREATRLGKFRANSDGQNNTTTGKEGTKAGKLERGQERAWLTLATQTNAVEAGAAFQHRSINLLSSNTHALNYCAVLTLSNVLEITLQGRLFMVQ